MIDRLLSHVAPHPCSGCAKTGRLLCDYCKYNIVSEYFSGCIACGNVAGPSGICQLCCVPYVRGWCVGERTDELRTLIDKYKFQNVRSADVVLAELFSLRIGQLPSETVVVPVPTIASHIRTRGYDHMQLIAKKFAREQHISLRNVVYRTTKTKQRGANRSVRMAQAKKAFAVSEQLSPSVPYLVIDDIVTTGATLLSMANVLRNAGAKTVWAAVLARQPLD